MSRVSGVIDSAPVFTLSRFASTSASSAAGAKSRHQSEREKSSKKQYKWPSSSSMMLKKCSLETWYDWEHIWEQENYQRQRAWNVQINEKQDSIGLSILFVRICPTTTTFLCNLITISMPIKQLDWDRKQHTKQLTFFCCRHKTENGSKEKDPLFVLTQVSFVLLPLFCPQTWQEEYSRIIIAIICFFDKTFFYADQSAM